MVEDKGLSTLIELMQTQVKLLERIATAVESGRAPRKSPDEAVPEAISMMLMPEYRYRGNVSWRRICEKLGQNRKTFPQHPMIQQALATLENASGRIHSGQINRDGNSTQITVDGAIEDDWDAIDERLDSGEKSEW